MVMIPRKGQISMVIIPMLHGDDPNATSKLNSTSQTEVSTERDVEITNTTETGGGGVNHLSFCLNNYKFVKTFLIFLQVIINSIQHMDSKSKKRQSHIRYTQRQIFTRKPIKGENLFFFEMIGSLLSFVHHI
jgi:hypothetical protein